MRKTKIEKPKQWPIRKMGKQYEYYEHEDGSITPDATYIEAFHAFSDENGAVQELMRILTQHCQALLLPIRKRERAVWQKLIDDYELDVHRRDFSYDPLVRRIIPRERTKKDPQ